MGFKISVAKNFGGQKFRWLKFSVTFGIPKILAINVSKLDNPNKKFGANGKKCFKNHYGPKSEKLKRLIFSPTLWKIYEIL